MLRRWKVDVVAYGPSLHDKDSWYLMRAYPSLEERQRSEDAFYRRCGAFAETAGRTAWI